MSLFQQKMETSGSKQHKDEISMKHSKSPFDLIVNQIWRSKSFSERWPQSSMARFFKVTENSNEAACVTEKQKEGKTSLDSENKENASKLSSDEFKSTDPEGSTTKWEQVIEFMERLGKEPDQKCMNLNNCSLTANDAVQLAALLPNLPQLEELDLSWNELIGGTLKVLTNPMQRIPQLRVLVLGSCRLSEMDLSALGDWIQHLPNVEEIDLSWNSDLGGNLSLFTQKLGVDSKLKILKLVDCDLTAKDAKALGQALSVITKLEVLDLSMNKDVGSGLETLFQELKHVPHLQVLKFHLCGLKGDSIINLAQILPLLSSLQVLNLALNKNIGNSLRHLIARLRFLPRLTTLVANNCNLSEESIVELADTIPNLMELETLDVSWNKCIGGNLGLLLRTLQSSSCLRVLKLCSCNLTGQDLESLVSVSRAGFLENLENLDLTYNNTVDDQYWAMFFQEISGLKELSELDIGLRPLTHRACDPWITIFLDSLVRFPSLTEFGMHHWVLSASQRKRLETFNSDNKRNILFHC
ncbi:leucine-rich repeat-containing protein 31-like isoform X2 [Chiloscyllium plagiosum]|uniref:leucine-rich repeat-containing protein 31-like isoform X2 n=1 Tax=Chiloscyllium plagiosum TaxID=36176 RepID=UPI001CB8014B|nr:leucine-rich repeat-containing protein 31-like isoform X2 [Chiloscyllium plagiosum]